MTLERTQLKKSCQQALVPTSPVGSRSKRAIEQTLMLNSIRKKNIDNVLIFHTIGDGGVSYPNTETASTLHTVVVF